MGAAAARRPAGAHPGWPDEGTIEAARDGDPASLAAVIDGAHPHVRRFAHSLCAGPQDAEDAAQEALIVLYRRIGTLRATGALASWMFRVVRNECLRRVRSAVAVRSGPPTAGGRTAEPTERSAEDSALTRLEAERIAAAVGLLPQEQRVVLLMRDVQGLPGPVVARSLGLSTPAMKSRLHRARSAVRRSLAAADAGPDGGRR
ncbi:RNA polymerase sigma factor [Kitasatospora sp. NPDC054939]